MKFHKQEHLYIPGVTTTGSCYPTVLACLLDKELHEVPYFHLLYFDRRTKERDNIKMAFQERYIDGYSRDEYEEIVRKNPDLRYKLDNYTQSMMWIHWLWDRVREYWLYGEGYTEEYITDIDKWLKSNKDVPYIVAGMSPRNISHVVIYMNGKMIHDPNPSNGGVIPNKDYPYTYLKKITQRIRSEQLGIQYVS